MAHAVSPEQLHERAARGGRARAVRQRTRRSEAAPFSDFRPNVTPHDVCKLLAPALTATYADAGLPGQADWETRLLALVALLSAFPARLRMTPDEARRVLEEVMPEAVQQSVERFDAEKGYREMRRALIQSRIRLSALGRLYVEPLPDWAFAPWESREEVMKNEAPNLSQARTVRANDGTLLLEREGEPGFVDVVQVDAA